MGRGIYSNRTHFIFFFLLFIGLNTSVQAQENLDESENASEELVDVLPEMIEDKVFNAEDGKRFFRGQMRWKKRSKRRLFCHKQSETALFWNGYVGDVQPEFTDNALLFHIQFEEFEIQLLHSKVKNPLCLWTGGNSLLNPKKLRLTLSIKAAENPGEKSKIGIERFSIEGLDIQKTRYFKNGIYYKGNPPAWFDKFVETNTNRLVRLALGTFLKKKINDALSDEIHKAIRDRFDGLGGIP